MPTPATSGTFRTALEDMQIGDYIAFKYTAGTSGQPGVVSEIGAPLATAQANEIPVVGSATPSGYAYAIKTAPGLVIADRIVQHSISWDTLNAVGLIQGKLYPSSAHISSTAYAVGYNPCGPNSITNAFDENIDTAWTTPTCGPTGWVGQSFPTKKLVKFVKIRGYDDVAGTYTYAIEASDDNFATVPFSIIRGKANISISKTKPVIVATEAITPYYSWRFRPIAYNTYIDILDMWMYDSNLVKIRSITGGVDYAKADGSRNPSSDAGYGAWPSCNEWDKYLVKSSLGGKIIAGDEAVWNAKQLLTFTTGAVAWSPGIYRVIRGPVTPGTRNDYLSYALNTGVYATVGFRPVFEFLEPNSPATTMYY